MTITELTMLYDYSYWANARLFQAIARLTDEEFTRHVAGSYGSVRTTLVHMMSAESGWLERCGGPPRGSGPLTPSDFPTLDAVSRRWTTIEGQVREFIASQSDADLDRRIAYTIPQINLSGAGRIGDLLHHAAVHNIHHRGQASLLVRALGHTPGNVDILFYYAERSATA
jgi:uncharacterized damage-inducible protein DinB